MKLRYLPMLTLLYLLPMVTVANPVEKIAELIKQGNAAELARYFAASLDISVLNESGVYSKAQSQMVLDRFFKENKPLSVKMLHRVSSNPNYNFCVLILNTDKGKYRVAYTLKEIDKVMTIIELRIEAEKT